MSQPALHTLHLRPPPRSTLLRILALLAIAAPAHARPPTDPEDSGEVTVALPAYRALVAERDALTSAQPELHGYALAERRLELAFDRGVLSGELVLSVETFASATPVEVPLLDAEASLAEVTLDGARAVALKSGRYYAVAAEKAGRHEVRLRFARGRKESRFSRAFVLPLPPAAVTRIGLELPEPGLDVELEGGVVLVTRPTERGTRVEAVLDGRAALSVRWQRRLGLARTGERTFEAESLALVSLSEEVLRTKTELRYRVTSGETDRLELAVPERLEVTNVAGDAVLQWYTEAPKGGAKKLVVLLRHLVDDQVTVLVTAELPRVHEDSAELAFLAPLDAPLREGWVAVEGRDGFDVKPKKVSGAEEVGTREVPAALTALSDKPLLFAYRHGSALPEVELQLAKNVQLELTQALVDDLQASTVLVEQGTEVTKLRLYVRNNTRQYLAMRLPEGAALTHALIDGVPFHPGVERDAGGERLLIPLRQSERLSVTKPRRHVVRPGETLGEISLLYFGRSDRWADLIAANPGLSGPDGLRVGQRLAVPARAGGVTLEESTFVLELAYKVSTPPLALAARHQVALPELDLPVMSATWHFYFPEAYEPLAFTSNLKQLTHVRYDPIRRVLQFLDDATRIRGAWAGGGPEGGAYSNILDVRKEIYQREQKREVTEALSSFPLVGERYRFSRVLLGDQQAFLELVYVKRSLVPVVQWTVLAAVLLLGLRALRAVRRDGLARAVLEEPVWTFGLAAAAALLLAHYVLGVHRHMVLGLDLALLVLVLPRVIAGWRARKGAAADGGEALDVFGLGRLLRARTLVKLAASAIAVALALTYPLLLSTFALLVLLVATFGVREARHE